MKKKSSKKNRTRKCPCCKQNVKTAPSNAADQIQFQKNEQGKFYICNFYANWVCDPCIADGKAIRAKAEKQRCGHGFPFYAYFDQYKTCIDCLEIFTFSAKAQQYWYETLQFFIDAKAIRCLACRKKNRAINKQNTLLSDLIKNLEATDKAALKQIIEIYEKMGKVEKVKYYQSLLRKVK